MSILRLEAPSTFFGKGIQRLHVHPSLVNYEESSKIKKKLQGRSEFTNVVRLPISKGSQA
jgi:hypothetical protein